MGVHPRLSLCALGDTMMALNEVTGESGLEIFIGMFPDAENQLRVLDDANRPNAPLGAFAVTCHIEYIVDDLVDMQFF